MSPTEEKERRAAERIAALDKNAEELIGSLKLRLHLNKKEKFAKIFLEKHPKRGRNAGKK